MSEAGEQGDSGLPTRDRVGFIPRQAGVASETHWLLWGDNLQTSEGMSFSPEQYPAFYNNHFSTNHYYCSRAGYEIFIIILEY